MYDLIIVGGGPAGITAGIYSARKRIKTLILAEDFIGQTGKSSEIENYPGFESISGVDLMNKFKQHLKKFDIEIKEGEVKEIKKINTNFEVVFGRDTISSRTVIVASGRNPRPLKIVGEEKYLGKGISYCSTCDAPFFKEKQVVVIGGGNSGFHAAIDLAAYAKKVYIIEIASKIRADLIYQERAKKLGTIEIILNSKVQEIKGEKWVEQLIIEDADSKARTELEVQGVFVEIGSAPATAFLQNLVDFNEGGEIKINSQNCETSTPGLFAAGDVTDVIAKQIVVAAGEGAKAALSAFAYLQKKIE